MTTLILNRSKQRWQIWAALAAAGLVHVGAVALAEHHEVDPVVAERIDEPFVDMTVAPAEALPPIGTPPVFAAPPVVEQSSTIPEENAAPPPIRRRTVSLPARVASPAVAAHSTTMRSAKILAVSGPRPEYPYEARRQRATGSGVASLTIDPATGGVTQVRMSRSTGNPVLDNATLSAFRRWRFKPGTTSAVECPITYTLTGAAY